jgi:hypothetical protein
MKDHIAADRTIDDALNFDPLDVAERVTGQSYKNDRATTDLGFLLMIENNDRKQQLLTLADDTTHSETLPRWQRIIGECGFETLLTLNVPADPTPNMEAWRDNKFFVCWHPDAILLVYDTFNGGATRNSADMYYNWKPHTDYWRAQRRVTANGSWHWVEQPGLPPEPAWADRYDKDGKRLDLPRVAEIDRVRRAAFEQAGIWCGTHDVREAIRHKLALLRQHGQFVCPWVKQPFLWLLHYMDTKVEGYDYKAIADARIAMLPRHVRATITPKVDPS